MAKDFESMDFERSGGNEQNSGFAKLNDSLIKNREILKDKSFRRESFKNNLNLDKKKISDSFFMREDSGVRDMNLSQHLKNQNSFDVQKLSLENRPKSFKTKDTYTSKLDDENNDRLGFDPVPSDDFFEEKGSESIIERNDEDSKFVDEESYSMVYLTKQQNSNNLRNSLKSTLQAPIDTNTKELSEIEDVETSKEHIGDDSVNHGKSENSKEKVQESMNSISNINSPYLKVDSLIGDSEIKDTKKIINELKAPNTNENSAEGTKQEGEPDNLDTVGLIFTEDDDNKKQRQQSEPSLEKIIVAKENNKRGSEFNSISEIFADRIDFDMSTIKEMVESLEEDSFHFRAHAKTELSKPTGQLNLAARDEQAQNSFEKIIKYMKKEINRIDAVKKRERDSQKVNQMMKDFICNLKRIELSPRTLDDEKKLKHPKTPGNISKYPEIIITKPKTPTSTSNKTAATKKFEEGNFVKLEVHSEPEDDGHSRPASSQQESMIKDEENITKDYAEPTPNKLPPMSTFSSKNQSPNSLETKPMKEVFYNEKVSDVFDEFLVMKNKKQMSHNASKEEFKTPEHESMPPEYLPNTPNDEGNKGAYKKYMNCCQVSTQVKEKNTNKPKTISKFNFRNPF